MSAHSVPWFRLVLSAGFLIVAIVRLWAYMRGRR